jgi:uncharacterized membrane protein YkgB
MRTLRPHSHSWVEERAMNNIIYLVGLVVIVVAILGFFGLR